MSLLLLTFVPLLVDVLIVLWKDAQHRCDTQSPDEARRLREAVLPDA